MVKKKRTRVSLNIKDPEAHRLAQAISHETGETMTHAVIQALRERYDRVEHRRSKASVEDLLGIANRIASRIKGPYLDHGTLLYDEHGLPK